MKFLDWIRGLGKKKKSAKVRHLEQAPEPRYNPPMKEKNPLKKKATAKGQARGAFGRPRGPFDPRPALKPAEMREKYTRI